MGRITVQSAKAKGRNLQNWVAKKISCLLGIPFANQDDEALISSRQMGQAGTDVILRGEALKRFPFSVECKNQEQWNIPAFIQQAKANQMENTDWLLFCKKNQMKAIVVIDAETFFKLLKQIKLNEKD